VDTDSTELCIETVDKDGNIIYGPFFELIATVADMNDKFIIRLNSVLGSSAFVSINYNGASDDLGDYLHQYYSQLSKV
jgi:hypothetical protein